MVVHLLGLYSTNFFLFSLSLYLLISPNLNWIYLVRQNFVYLNIYFVQLDKLLHSIFCCVALFYDSRILDPLSLLFWNKSQLTQTGGVCNVYVCVNTGRTLYRPDGRETICTRPFRPLQAAVRPRWSVGSTTSMAFPIAVLKCTVLSKGVRQTDRQTDGRIAVLLSVLHGHIV